jgi:SEC-C motif
MRLPVEKIKAAILDSDGVVRTAAADYFAQARSTDPGLMPLVSQAFERFGGEAFARTSFLDDLEQTDESIDWICRQIDRIDPEVDERSENLVANLSSALRHADAALLERHAATIREIRRLDADSKSAISNRIQLASLSPQDVWQRLIEFADAQDQLEQTSKQDYEFGCSLVDALAPYRDLFADEVLTILAREEAEDWLEVMAVQLAGAMRLEAAIPALLSLLGDFDTWAAEGARRSLIEIGTDAVVGELSRVYVEDEDLRLDIACLLESVHSDFSIQTCLKLFDQEQDEELRGLLIRSALMNFASEAIEPARQSVLASEKTPDVLEVRGALLVACKMLDERFPEFDAWLEDSSHDAEFRRAWYKEHPRFDFSENFEPDDENEDDWDADDVDDELEMDFDDQSAEPIVRQDPKIGRNDPCPCGSGKKYKKCCLHKRALG